MLNFIIASAIFIALLSYCYYLQKQVAKHKNTINNLEKDNSYKQQLLYEKTTENQNLQNTNEYLTREFNKQTDYIVNLHPKPIKATCSTATFPTTYLRHHTSTR